MKWPHGWREVPFQPALGKVVRGVTFSREDASDEPIPDGIPVLRAGNIQERLITNQDLVWIPKRLVSDEQVLQRGDVVVCTSSGSSHLVGKAALLDHEFYGTFGAFNAVMRCDPSVLLPEYLHFWLMSPLFDRWRSRLVAGASIQNIRQSDLAALRIVAPPPPEQQRIVEMLQAADLRPFYEAASRADSLREAIVGFALSGGLTAAWVNQNAAEVQEAALQRNKLLGIEEKTSCLDWPIVPLLAVCELNPKLEANVRTAADSPVTFVPMAAVDEHLGAITSPEERPYAEVQKGYTAFAEGDVLFAKVTPCMENGKAAVAHNLIGGIGFGSTEFHVLRPDTRLILAEYLLHFIRQPAFREQAKAAFVGTGGLQRVPPDFFKRVKLPLPSLPEQRRIVDALKHVAPQSFHSAIEQAKRLRSALIAEALSGRLTAAWREQHAQALAEAARERDARLGAPAPRVTVRITEHAPTERRTDLARPRRQAVIEQLSSFQHAVWNTLRVEWRGAVLTDDPAAFEEFCTSPQTAWRQEGFAAGREQVRRALEQLAAMGLIRKMSLPRPDPNTGRTEYLTAFRPLREAEDGSRPEEDTALADAERLARELERRRAPEAR